MATANTSRQQRLSVEGYCYGELMPLVEVTLKAGVSVLLRGHPGVGKSSMASQLAKRMNLPMVDIRLAQRDPAELAGVYFPDRKRKVLSLFPPKWIFCRLLPHMVYMGLLRSRAISSMWEYLLPRR